MYSIRSLLFCAIQKTQHKMHIAKRRFYDSSINSTNHISKNIQHTKFNLEKRDGIKHLQAHMTKKTLKDDLFL